MSTAFCMDSLRGKPWLPTGWETPDDSKPRPKPRGGCPADRHGSGRILHCRQIGLGMADRKAPSSSDRFRPSGFPDETPAAAPSLPVMDAEKAPGKERRKQTAAYPFFAIKAIPVQPGPAWVPTTGPMALS